MFTGANVAAAEAADSVVPDLRTRKTGVDWPCFLGSNHDSKSPEQGILTQWPPEGLHVRWQRELGTSYGAPSVAKGRLFHFDRFGEQSRLTCLKSETGEFLWKFEYSTDYEDLYGYNNGPRCCPVVDGDRVYIYGVAGMLHCLRVTDGKLLWKVDTAKQFGVVQNFFGVGSTPTVYRDWLIVQVGGSPAESREVPSGQLDRVVGNGSGIVAFNKFTGAVKYQTSNELASYSSPVIRHFGGRAWCFVFARGGLLGFEPNDGKIDFFYPWRAKILESVNASNPVVVGERVFISETYGPGSSLLRVKPGGYDIVWADPPGGRAKSMQTHWNTSVHHKGYLYGSSGRHTNTAQLRCIELATGKVMWNQPRVPRSSLLYVDNHFLALTEYGALLLFKATPEKLDVVASCLLRRSEIPDPAVESSTVVQPPPLLRYPAWAAPVLSHGLLYVRGADRLVCLELIPAD